MVELRALHLTDFEDEFDKLEVVRQYIEKKKGSTENIDCVLVTGDWIHGHMKYGQTAEGKPAIVGHNGEEKTATLVFSMLQALEVSPKMQEVSAPLEQFAQKHGGEQFDTEKLEANVRKEFDDLRSKAGERWKALAGEAVTNMVKHQYGRHADIVQSMGCPVYGIMGNHDLTPGYDILGKAGVTFLEKQTEPVKIQGRSGVEFTLRGDLNTMEVPVLWGMLSGLLKDYFVPYESGVSFDALSQEVRNLETKIGNGRQRLLANAAGKDTKKKEGEVEEPVLSREEIDKLDKVLEQFKAERDGVLNYYTQERKRLGGTPQPVDIYLTHRSPRCKEARKGKVAGSDCSDTTRDFSKGATVIYSGHFHGGQIGLEGFRDDSPMEKGLKGLRTLKDRLEEARGKGDVIDVYGETAAVLYLDEKEPWELNPGNEYFMVTEFNTAKNVEQVLIYEFTYD